MLEVQHITVSYGDFSPVKDVSFTLNSGEWLMLCGPNGAGKSTLLGAISGGCQYSGDILINGKNIRNVKRREKAQAIGFLMQHNYVNYAFTVEEIVSLGRYAYAEGFLKGESRDDRLHIDRALSVTGLDRLRNQSALTLSGGELQRTFLAQLFCQDPCIMVLDEPANHLDPVYQKQIFTLIGEWLKTPGRAVLSVVHDLSLARLFGTHALLMGEGRILSSGSIKEALSAENLKQAYEMDMFAWMDELHNSWL